MNPLHLIAAVLIAEAGGEPNPRQAMEAVHEVIYTRAVAHGISPAGRLAGRMDSMRFVVLREKQFSCLNKTRPETLIARAQKHPLWDVALDIVMSPATNHALKANHYCRVDCNPRWSRKQKPVAVIGHHKFFRL